MYHIKNDKRSHESARLIVEGFFKCLDEKKDFSKITITDIQKTSTVGRATFYRLFDALADVLSFECDKAVKELADKCKTLAQKSWHEAIVYYFEFGIERKKLLEAIIKSGHLEILYESFSKNSDEIGEIIHLDENLSGEEKEYFMKILSLEMAGIFEVWTKNGEKENAEELTRLLEKIVRTLYLTMR